MLQWPPSREALCPEVFQSSKHASRSASSSSLQLSKIHQLCSASMFFQCFRQTLLWIVMVQKHSKALSFHVINENEEWVLLCNKSTVRDVGMKSVVCFLLVSEVDQNFIWAQICARPAARTSHPAFQLCRAFAFGILERQSSQLPPRIYSVRCLNFCAWQNYSGKGAAPRNSGS